MNKCECPNEGELGCPESWYDAVTELPYVNHKPHECKCINDIRGYMRNGKQLMLCSICNMPSDVMVCD